ncbi:TerB family tellurite resistance protein [Muriicola soli]|uniref:TerB family tellurite resistance protein n=1 Tax=Muriicola soli TaxID=2507538 RepID=A0A411E628_9FLAO|nr:TerB family tellurite resistance protein [Muriicola soli]QBA63166.1 TerB family tellurite resistance protein [Muriicola soli]
MPIKDLYSHSEKRNNLAHFAAIASLAAVDGEINASEQKVLDKFAVKLDITGEEIREVMKKENKYPIEAPYKSEQRLERLYDLFRIIFADRRIDEDEVRLIKKYALALGYSPEKAESVIRRSIILFMGKFDFEDYLYMMRRKTE